MKLHVVGFGDKDPGLRVNVGLGFRLRISGAKGLVKPREHLNPEEPTFLGFLIMISL